jgi:hypothetical protein
MYNTEKLEEAVKLLGELTTEQKQMVEDTLSSRMEKSMLVEKLGVDAKKIQAFLKAAAAAEEDAVFRQEVSEDDLQFAAGGKDLDDDDCTGSFTRNIHEGRFPNCASSVEAGSRCESNDACGHVEVVYTHVSCTLFHCTISWR